MVVERVSVLASVQGTTAGVEAEASSSRSDGDAVDGTPAVAAAAPDFIRFGSRRDGPVSSILW